MLIEQLHFESSGQNFNGSVEIKRLNDPNGKKPEQFPFVFSARIFPPDNTTFTVTGSLNCNPNTINITSSSQNYFTNDSGFCADLRNAICERILQSGGRA